MHKLKWFVAIIIFITAAVVLASTGGGFNLFRHVTANGGQLSSNGGYTLNGSIGQHVVATSSGNGYTLISGFWGGYSDVAQTPTFTPLPPTSTFTPDPSTATSTPVSSTATSTPDPSTATSTPVSSTATNTPDAPTATATEQIGTELLVNGGFEIDTAAPLKQPDSWNVTLKSQDKIKCNTATTIVAFTGNCAYFFKGSAAEATRMSQKPDLTLHTFNAGDTLTFTVQYKTNATAPKLKYKVIVRYTDSAAVGKIKGTINSRSAASYTQLAPLPYVLVSGNLQMIKVQFQNRALGGKIFIDDASLIHMDNSAARSR